MLDNKQSGCAELLVPYHLKLEKKYKEILKLYQYIVPVERHIHEF